MAKRSNFASLGVSLIARTRSWVRGMKRMKKDLRTFSRSVGRIAKQALKLGVAISGIGIAAGYMLARVTMAGERFNRKLRRSQAIMSGLSKQIRADMVRTALEVARTTTFSAEQAAESYFFLASAGLSARQSIDALPIVAKFAQAGMFDLAHATDLLTDAQSALGLTVKDAQQNMLNMTDVGDVLVKANTLANASVEQFSESLTTKAGAALKILNKDIEEGVAVLAAFADQGIKSSEAGTALNIVLRDLSTKAIRNARAFRKHRIAVFDTVGNMNNLAQIVGDIERALFGMSDATKKATLLELGFSDKSVIFMQTLLGLSAKIAMYENRLRRAGGTMARVAERQLTPFEKTMARLQAEWVEFSLTLEPILLAVGVGIDWLIKKLRTMMEGLTPLKVAIFLHDTLNAIDLFVRRAAHAFTQLVHDILLSVSTILEALPFMEVPIALAKRLEAATLRQYKQAQFLRGVEARAPGFVSELLGSKVFKEIRKPIADAQAQYLEEQAQMFKERMRDFWGMAEYHLKRFVVDPVAELEYWWKQWRGGQKERARERAVTAIQRGRFGVIEARALGLPARGMGVSGPLLARSGQIEAQQLDTQKQMLQQLRAINGNLGLA